MAHYETVYTYNGTMIAKVYDDGYSLNEYFAGFDFMGSADWVKDGYGARLMEEEEAEAIIEELKAADEPAEPESNMGIKIETKTNGYTAESLQKMIGIFEKAAANLFPGCTVQHFYYGDYLDMVDLIIGHGDYGHFNLTANRVSLNGYSVSNENYQKIGSMTFNDECYNGKLMELI